VQNHNNPAADPATPADLAEPTEPTPAPAPLRRPWQTEASELMSQAAALCIEHGVDIERYMSGAWASYVEARPGLRAELEEAQLRAHLAELRQLGRLASA
jgi:hypothetical protein